MITESLAAPFAATEVKFKPQSVKGNRALALAYVDARVIEDRLDDVLGVAGWQDEYETLPDGSVICRLRLKIDGEWITKVDVGSPSEQPDGGDRMKAAFSDALKRAAVKFGIGRYLYRAPQTWCDYDPVKKQFTQLPKLPSKYQPQQPQEQPPAIEAAKTEPKKSAVPTTWAELEARLIRAESKMIEAGIATEGVLFRALREWKDKERIPNHDFRAWPAHLIPKVYQHMAAVIGGISDQAKQQAQQPAIAPPPAGKPATAPQPAVDPIGQREADEITREQLTDSIVENADISGQSVGFLIQQHSQHLGFQPSATIPQRLTLLSLPQLKALAAIVAALAKSQPATAAAGTIPY